MGDAFLIIGQGQADRLKRHGMFDDAAVASMMDLFEGTEDRNELSGILYALKGVVTTTEFRDQILATMQEEIQSDNPSPKFRHTAIEALEPMLPDPAVEEWLRYLAENDPEPKLQNRAVRSLGDGK